MNHAAVWLDARTSGAPPVLLARVREWLQHGTPTAAELPMARAGELALRAAVERGAGREAALDLLAADALITLALLECAGRDPAELAATARSLRDQAAAAV